MPKMQLDIVTAERLISSNQVDFLVAPGTDGEFTVLPHHAPLLTTLKPGELRVVNDGKENYIVVSGGFLEMIGNKATILADTAERADEIDLERAEEAFQRAKERTLNSKDLDDNLEQRLSAMRRSEARIKVARRRKKTPR